MRDDDLIYLFTGTSDIFIKNRMKRIIQSFDKFESTIIKYDMETLNKRPMLLRGKNHTRLRFPDEKS